MTFGTDIGGVRRTRSYAGEVNAGLAGEVRKAGEEETAPVEVKVTGTLAQDGTYALTVEAMGQSTTAKNVSADALAERITRLIQVVSKAAARGDLNKHRTEEPVRLGTAHTFTRKNPRDAFSG